MSWRIPASNRRIPATGRSQRPVVLHVVEAYGGGVMNVIHDYIRATPHYEHHILRTQRPGHDTGSEPGLDPSRVTLLPRGPFGAVRTIATTVSRLRPAIVHAHSSMAGAYVRLCPRARTRTIYYTPHCFAFERTDIPPPVRYGFRFAEQLLAQRTRHFVAVSERELELAQRLTRRIDGTYVPNIASVPPQLVGTHSRRSPTVVTIGRVMEQKDPKFFLDVVRAASDVEGVRWLWLGDGPEELVEPLKAAGVEVSGWLPRRAVLDQLNSAAVYLHTASWEGSPLSILEAATIGLPMVVRETPATVSLHIDGLVRTPHEAAREIGRICTAESESADHDSFLARHTVTTQADSLAAAYRAVSPRSWINFRPIAGRGLSDVQR